MLKTQIQVFTNLYKLLTTLQGEALSEDFVCMHVWDLNVQTKETAEWTEERKLIEIVFKENLLICLYTQNIKSNVLLSVSIAVWVEPCSENSIWFIHGVSLSWFLARCLSFSSSRPTFELAAKKLSCQGKHHHCFLFFYFLPLSYNFFLLLTFPSELMCANFKLNVYKEIWLHVNDHLFDYFN